MPMEDTEVAEKVEEKTVASSVASTSPISLISREASKIPEVPMGSNFLLSSLFLDHSSWYFFAETRNYLVTPSRPDQWCIFLEF